MRRDGTGLAGTGPDERSLLEMLTESTDDALWMFSPDWTELRFVNSAYEDIFGGTVEELAEDPTEFLTRTHPADRERVSEGMATLSAGETTDMEFRVNPDTDYGTWVWVQGQPVFEDGELAALGGYIRDITERKGYQQDLELHIADHDATVTVEELPRVRTDRDQLRQVFQNLVKNAIDHADGTGATVEVGAEDLENAVEFWVTDDGPGIPPEKREQVFEGGYSTEEQGTGFGLQIVEQIASAHDWGVEVTESSAGGAKFCITDIEPMAAVE